jgi:hypothetical protein
MRMRGDSAQVDGMTVGRLSNVRATKLLTEPSPETCPGLVLHCSLPDNGIPEAEIAAGFIDETTEKLAAPFRCLAGVRFAPSLGP